MASSTGRASAALQAVSVTAHAKLSAYLWRKWAPVPWAFPGPAGTGSRVLIETTGMPMAQVAFAAGFASVRQFNDTVQAVFAVSASELRRKAGPPALTAPGQTLTLRLPFRAPLCVYNLFGHLAATAVPGVEEMRDGAYRRSLRLPHGVGLVALRPAEDCIWASLSLADLRDLTSAVARCRRLLDLDADPHATDERLCEDPALARLVRSAPGRRVPRTVDDAGDGGPSRSWPTGVHRGGPYPRRAARHGVRGTRQRPGRWSVPDLSDAIALAEALSAPAQPGLGPLLAGPRAREATLAGVVGALADGKIDLGPGADWEEARAQLGQLGGVGPGR